MHLFAPSFFNRFSIYLLLALFALSVSISGCSSKPAEEQYVKVTKRMKIEYPKKVAKKKVTKKKTVKKKVVSTGRPDVKWVSPRKATIKKKKSAKAKAAPARKVATKKTSASTKTTAPSRKKASATVTYASSSETNYVVSLSSFTDRVKAILLAKKITADGYNCYVTDTVVKGTRWYRTRCGFFKGYTEATKVKEKLTKRYFARGAWVDKPTRAEVAKYAK